MNALPFDDNPIQVLLQKGNEGLFLALKTFADYPNRSFSGHAVACVEDAIRRAIADSE